jgi:protein-disulfide isomerase
MAATLISGAAEFDLEKFVRNILIPNPRIKVEKVTPLGDEALKGHKDWRVYSFSAEIEIGAHKKKLSEKVFINTKENLATLSLWDFESGSNLREAVKNGKSGDSNTTKSAIGSGEFRLDAFVKNVLLKDSKLKVEKVIPLAEKPLEEYKEWKAYLFYMKITVNGKTRNIAEKVFVNTKEGLATVFLLDMKKKLNLRDIVQPDMDNSFYDREHLVAGNPDAIHKIVIFSDPQCPVCIDYFPGLLEDVKKHPDKVALYYYHMPLVGLHPVSDTLTRVMEYLQRHGRTEEAMKMYDLVIDFRLRDEKKILSEIKKQLKIDLNIEEINRSEIRSAIKKDMEKAASMMVRGTPTVFFDGKYDPGRRAYKKVLK